MMTKKFEVMSDKFNKGEICIYGNMTSNFLKAFFKTFQSVMNVFASNISYVEYITLAHVCLAALVMHNSVKYLVVCPSHYIAHSIYELERT
jgi:hypothetical protein